VASEDIGPGSYTRPQGDGLAFHGSRAIKVSQEFPQTSLPTTPLSSNEGDDSNTKGSSTLPVLDALVVRNRPICLVVLLLDKRLEKRLGYMLSGHKTHPFRWLGYSLSYTNWWQTTTRWHGWLMWKTLFGAFLDDDRPTAMAQKILVPNGAEH